jgi:hypothetical protein
VHGSGSLIRVNSYIRRQYAIESRQKKTIVATDNGHAHGRKAYAPSTLIPGKKLDRMHLRDIRKINVYFIPAKIRRRVLPRCIGVTLFLFVFTLPLHFHPATESPQVSQECGCYYGARTQLGPAPAPVILVPIYQAVLLFKRNSENPAAVVIESESARAPPYSL